MYLKKYPVKYSIEHASSQNQDLFEHHFRGSSMIFIAKFSVLFKNRATFNTVYTNRSLFFLFEHLSWLIGIEIENFKWSASYI